MAPDVQAEDLSRPEDQRPIADRIGRRQQDQPLAVVRQLVQARYVLSSMRPGRSPASGSANPPASSAAPRPR